jgi:hypothetical protein
LYLQKKPDIELIIKNAEDNLPHWEEAIREFEIRFSNMPFSVDVENKADAVLNAKTPSIKFKYKGKDIPRDKLVEDVLSQGEKRAFYLLNVIFQIKSRKLENKRTLFIVDDIADSFDYRNKYAIVEYLKDLSRVENFYVIVLTHNFDFFRTLRSRILFRPFNNTHSYVAERTDSQIFLIPAVNKNVIDPFANWRLGVNNNQKHLIACVPFVRNLIEFKFGTNHKYFIQLTHVLHIKQQDTVNDVNATVDISIADIEPIFNEVLSGIKFTFDNKDTLKLVAVIDSVAEGIIHEKNTDTIILEDKIILAISIRLKAEKFMLSIMSDIETIDDNQTGYLIRTYKERFRDQEGQNDIIKTLETVGIITPENIHLNSFMYEPILDMGIDELIRLYGAVSSF